MKKQIVALAVAAALSSLIISGCSQTGVGKAVVLPTDFAVPEIAAADGEISEPEEQGKDLASSDGSSVEPSASAGSSSKPSSGGSSAEGSGASSGVEPSVPSHEHSWTHHPAAYQESPIYESRVVCSCGQQFGSVEAWDSHMKSLGFGADHSYSVRRVQVGTEQVLVAGEYWSCSCGATK